MEQSTAELHSAEGLIGTMFTTAKELRHLAEQALGQLFVPTEVLAADEHTAEMVLRPSGMGEILVHAERERHWYPFQITRVDTVTARAADPMTEQAADGGSRTRENGRPHAESAESAVASNR